MMGMTLDVPDTVSDQRTMRTRAKAPFTMRTRIHRALVPLISDAFQEPPRLWLNWMFDFLRAGPMRPFGTTRRMFRDRIEKQLPWIMTPTLVIRGEHDTTVPDRWARAVVSSLALGEYMVVPRVAHCAHYTRPEWVATRMLSWTSQAMR